MLRNPFLSREATAQQEACHSFFLEAQATFPSRVTSTRPFYATFLHGFFHVERVHPFN